MQSAPKGGGEPESAGWGGHAALPEGRWEPPPFTFLGNPPPRVNPPRPALADGGHLFPAAAARP